MTLNTAITDTKILIVDDERTTREALGKAFEQRGYHVSLAASGDKAWDMLTAVTYDVVLLDLQMPGLSGDEILAKADQIAPETAFVVLTAYASADTAIIALRSGAVDYLRKPSPFEVIFAAIDKAVKRQQSHREQQQATIALEKIKQTLQLTNPLPDSDHQDSATNTIAVGSICINESSQTVTYKNTPLELTPIEYHLLHTLASQPNTVLSYAYLAQISHKTDLEEDEARSLLRAHIYRLRHKLSAIGPPPIETVRGRGIILQNPY